MFITGQFGDFTWHPGLIHPKRWFPRFQESADNFEFSAERLSEIAKSIKITLFAELLTVISPNYVQSLLNFSMKTLKHSIFSKKCPIHTKFFVAIYALFPQIFWNWKAQSADFIAFRMYVHNQRTFYYFFANKKYPQLSWVGWTTGTGFYRYVLWIYEFLKTLLHNIQHAQHSGIHCVAVVFSYICFLRVPLQIAMHCWSLEKAFITCTIFRDV